MVSSNWWGYRRFPKMGGGFSSAIKKAAEAAKKKKAAVKVQKTTKNPVTELDETNDIDEVDEEIARVMKILNVVNEESMNVNDDNLKKYFDYLNDHLDFSDLVTGMEDFRWEEYYVFGPGDQMEYEKLKKKNPSYTDHYQVLKEIRWDEFGRMLMTYEGFHFKLEIFDRSDEIP